LAKLAKSEFELAAAQKAAKKAQDDLNAAQKTAYLASVKVNDKVNEYNKLLRSGASKDVLAAKLKEVNAAKEAQKAADKDVITAQEKLTSAQDILTVLQETRDIQKELVGQMLEIMQAQIAAQNAAKAAAAGGAGAGAAAGVGDIAGALSKGLGKVDLSTTMSKAIDDAKAKILGKLNELWTSMQNTAKTAMAPFIAPLQAAWARLLPLLQTALTSVITWAQGWGETFKRFWEDHGASIIAVFTKLWTTIQGDILPNLLAAVAWAWGAIQTVIKAALDFIGFVFDLWAAYIKGGWAAVWDIIKEKLNAVGYELQTKVQEFTDNMKEKLQAFWDDVKIKWDVFWTGLVNFLGAQVSKFIQLVIDIVSGVTKKIVGFIEDTKLSWSTFWQGLIDYVRGLYDGFWKAGAYIIQGIIDGINSVIARLRTLVGSLGKDLPEWLKKLLGMTSPSKVFMEIGVNMMKGLAKGIQVGAVIPEKAVRAAAVNVARPVYQRGNTTNNVNMNMGGFNVNNGMDVAMIKTIIRQTVAEAVGGAG
jgi:hypothetical protein